MKKCTHCGEWKDEGKFNKQKAGKDGLRAYCRECQKNMAKEYRESENGRKKRLAWKKTNKGKECEKRYRQGEAYRKRKETEYASEEYKEAKRKKIDRERFSGMRQAVLARDGYKCVLCGSTEQLQIHHKDHIGRNHSADERNDTMENLVTLCASCHIKQHNPVLVRWGYMERGDSSAQVENSVA